MGTRAPDQNAPVREALRVPGVSLRELVGVADKNHLFLKLSSDGVHILDLEGRCVEASDAFCAMLGYEHAEVIGTHVAQWDGAFAVDPRGAAFSLHWHHLGHHGTQDGRAGPGRRT